MTSIVFSRRDGSSTIAAYASVLVWASLLTLGCVVQMQDRLTTSMLAAMALTTITQFGVAVAFFPLLTKGPRVRLAAFALAAIVIFASPFLIPAEAGPLRFVTSCAAVVMVLKLWDLHSHVACGLTVEWSRFLPFLCNVFSIVLRKAADEVRPARRQVLVDLTRGIAGSLAGALAVLALYVVPWRETTLLVEHAVKALVIFLSALSFAATAIALVRLGGGVMRDFSRAPLVARTPADFWRRYNRVIQQYFHENVFKRIGGRRSPAAVTVLIFLLSALIHEYVFGIAIGRVQGYQTAFFLLQGMAVAATLRMKPRGRAAIFLSTAATLLFNLFTSFFFFLSFHEVVPLYANPIPGWLQW